MIGTRITASQVIRLCSVLMMSIKFCNRKAKDLSTSSETMIQLILLATNLISFLGKAKEERRILEEKNGGELPEDFVLHIPASDVEKLSVVTAINILVGQIEAAAQFKSPPPEVLTVLAWCLELKTLFEHNPEMN